MSECDGTERHTHYIIAESKAMSHIHVHSINEKEFNRLHHHKPTEHNDFTEKELLDTFQYELGLSPLF